MRGKATQPTSYERNKHDMILKKGSTGQAVIQWQKFLTEQGYNVGALDGIFGAKVETATKAWQTKNGLVADGMVGTNSFSKAGLIAPASDGFPPRPNFSSPSTATVQQLFGSFAYKKRSDGTVQITDDWASKNIVKVFVPQLVGVPFAPKDGQIFFHKKAVPQLLAAFAEIEQKGLKDRIISWSGSYYPRMVRGSSSRLSNHSWGTAFDINAPENWLGKQPAKLGQKGCLLELVPIFNKWGFYWGGHYSSRLDGMHFECAKIITDVNGQIDAFNPQVSMPETSAPANQPVENPTDTTHDTPAETPASKSTGMSLPSLDAISGYAERVGDLGNKSQPVIDNIGKVSRSSIVGTVLMGIVGIGQSAVVWTKENPLVAALITLAIFAVVAWLWNRSKERAHEEGIVALKGIGSG